MVLRYWYPNPISFLAAVVVSLCPPVQPQRSAYRRGYEDFHAGVWPHHNPYPAYSPSRVLWDEGFLDAQKYPN